jgi:hypothetical protein
MRFLPAHAYLDDARIIFHQTSHRLASQTPQLSQLADAVVLFGVTGIGRQLSKSTGGHGRAALMMRKIYEQHASLHIATITAPVFPRPESPNC